MLKKKNKSIILVTSAIIVVALFAGYFIQLNDDSTLSHVSPGKNRQAWIAGPAEVEYGSAGPTPEEIVGKQTPAQKLKRLNLGTAPQQELKVKLPQSREKIVNPPQWSQPQNTLSDPSEPPDPFKKPPMKVDPRRMPEDAGSDVSK
jgi:hypothetical protein